MLEHNKIYSQFGGLTHFKIIGAFGSFFVGMYVRSDGLVRPEISEYRAYLPDGKCIFPEDLKGNKFATLVQEYLPPVEASYDIVWTTNKLGGLGAMICCVGSKHPDAGKEVARQTVTYKYSPKVGV